MTGALAMGATAALPSLVQAKAPLQGVSPASVHRYKVGSVEVTAILDGVWPVEKPETIFGTNQKPEDVAALIGELTHTLLPGTSPDPQARAG